MTATSHRLLWLALAGEGALAAIGLAWAAIAGHPLVLGPIGPGVVAGVASAIGLAAVQWWLLRFAPDYLPVRALRRLYRDSLRPIFARVTFLEIAIISVFAGLGEELLFRGAVQAAWGPFVASVLFGLCHVGGRATVPLGLWAAIVGGFLAWLAVTAGGLLAPIVTHALYDALALSYIRWGRDVGETPAAEPASVPAPDESRDDR